MTLSLLTAIRSFVDLARYFCGDADLDTVTAMAIKATDPMGELAKLPVDEAHIPPEHRCAVVSCLRRRSLSLPGSRV